MMVGATLGDAERASSWPLPLAVTASPVSVTWPRTGDGIKAFTGRDWDPETGLYYYRARYYDPKVGAFISEDPVDFQDGLTRYGYVLGNPVNLIDPTGWMATARMSCGADCPPDVKDGVRDACIGGRTHPDAWVRRCMNKQCRTATVTCLSPNDPICRITSRSGNRSSAFANPPNNIQACPSNPPPPWSCWKRVIMHEAAIHNCAPGGQQPGPLDHMALSHYFIKTVRCP